MRRNSQRGGGSSHDIEAEEKDEDNYEGKCDYDYHDNSTIDDLWYKLQCYYVFDSGPRTLHNHTTWIYLCLAYGITVGYKNSNLYSSTSSLRGDEGFAVPHQTVQFIWR